MVAMKVPIAINAWTGFSTPRVKNSLGLINLATAPITVAPKIALGKSESKGVKGSTAKTKAPVIAPAHGVSAPANLFNELLPNEPPTGNAFERVENDWGV